MRDIKKVEELIADLRIQFVSKSISERAYELMKKFSSSHGVEYKVPRSEINDMLIAATAIETEAIFTSIICYKCVCSRQTRLNWRYV